LRKRVPMGVSRGEKERGTPGDPNTEKNYLA